MTGVVVAAEGGGGGRTGVSAGADPPWNGAPSGPAEGPAKRKGPPYCWDGASGDGMCGGAQAAV